MINRVSFVKVFKYSLRKIQEICSPSCSPTLNRHVLNCRFSPFEADFICSRGLKESLLSQLSLSEPETINYEVEKKLFDPINLIVDEAEVFLVSFQRAPPRRNHSRGLEEPFQRAEVFFIAGGRSGPREQTPDGNVNVRLRRSTFNLCPDATPLSPPRLGCPSHLAGILLFWRRCEAVTDEPSRSERIMGEKKSSSGEMKNWSVDVRDERLSAVGQHETSSSTETVRH